MSSDSRDDNVPLQNLVNTSKKKKIKGRVLEASKHLRNHTYKTGVPCNCSNLRCFDVINSSERQALIRNFNKMKDRNEQNAYLCGLISMKDICRRRPRKDKGRELHKAKTENKLHKLKAEAFYKAKRSAKKKFRKQDDWKVITMDYRKNLPVPNITTSDVYYKR
ncbi:hypothetical protein ILUMI_14224 [Ignelater luminosus]|uniref:Uncharacterized protein n=1 Tax=Ignelater luminosus TaxID=2038154 RepID=A0A8K0CSW3_IGNLU|nr:hypothetical protein ILUMI_14224 [Ignelater luminosus]